MNFTGERVVPEKTPQRIYDDHVARYRFASNYVVDKVVLDAACGTGYGTVILKNAGAKRVVGLDISVETINHALQTYKIPGVIFKSEELGEVSLPEEDYDVVVSFETIEHVSDPERTLESFSKCLRPGGLLIISSPNRIITSPGYCPGKGHPLNKFHLVEYSVSEFHDLLNRYFRTVCLYGQRNSFLAAGANCNRILSVITSATFGSKVQHIPWLCQPRYITAVCTK